MTPTTLLNLLHAAGLDVEVLESSPGLNTKTLRYYHIDKHGKRLGKPVTREDFKKALDVITFYVYD